MKPGVQWLRHAVQLVVLLAIIAVPVLMQYRVLVAQNRIELVRAQEDGSLPRSILVVVDDVLRDGDAVTADDGVRAGNAAVVETLGRVQGNHWSAKVFGVSWTDPLAAVESMSAGRKVTLAVLIGLIVPVVLTLLLGRVFCSWICPAGLLFDAADKVRNWLQALNRASACRPRPSSSSVVLDSQVKSEHEDEGRVRGRYSDANVRKAVGQRRDISFWRGNKYVLLGAGLVVSFIAGVPLLGYFYPPALIGREIGHAVQGFFGGLVNGSQPVGLFVLTGASVFLAILVGIELFVSRRMWCRYLCPGGAIYSVLGRKRAVRLQNELSVCTGCTECIPACPMGLNPMKNQFGQECDLCLECRTACQPGAIRFRHPLSQPVKVVQQRRAA